jgi:DNA-binding MarR family transcriptional regulator
MKNPIILVSSTAAEGQQAAPETFGKQQVRTCKHGLPASHQLLCLMAAEGGITSRDGALHLGWALQSARNALGKLVRQGRAVVTRAESKHDFAIYSITPKGCAVLDSAGDEVDLSEDNEAEEQRKEHAERRARAERNIARALQVVPRSVFDLGRCAAAGARA